MSKKKILIIALVIVVLGAGIYFFGLWYSKESAPKEIRVQDNLASNQQNVPANGSITENKLPSLSAEEITKNELTPIARSFIERYGSYTKENAIISLQELSESMTPKLVKQSEAVINQNKTDFQEITTKVISYNWQKIEENNAVFEAVCQQKEIRSGQESISYKNVVLYFVKESAQWKVDDIVFSNKD